MNLAELITKAAKAAGDQTQLAVMLDVMPHRVTEWKKGTRPCPLHTQARIAELAGEDPKEWVWRQVCHQMGRVAAAVLLALAASLAAIGAHGVDGSRLAGKRTR